MILFATMPPGTAIIAAADIGPLVRGQPGMIIAPLKWSRRPWQRQYLCIFLGGITLAVAMRHVMRRNHGFSRSMLEDPRWFLSTRAVAELDASLVSAPRRPTAID